MLHLEVTWVMVFGQHWLLLNDCQFTSQPSTVYPSITSGLSLSSSSSSSIRFTSLSNTASVFRNSKNKNKIPTKIDNFCFCLNIQNSFAKFNLALNCNFTLKCKIRLKLLIWRIFTYVPRRWEENIFKVQKKSK